jgi:hypothetical protein
MVQKNTVTKGAMAKVNGLFSQRNRKASTVAARLGVAKDFGTRRVDQLAPAEIITLAEMM